MTDEELVKRLDNLWAMLEEDGYYVKANTVTFAKERIKALTEQLEAARHDAKEAEAYAEELERDLNICRMAQVVMDNGIAELEQKLATCEKYRDAYAECDRIGTQAVRDLEAKLAENEVRLSKAVESLRVFLEQSEGILPGYHEFARAMLAEIESSEAVTLGEKG